jgi:prolyl-tRNA editing enzyme YbaK/EbsC (Cys-tRNA(Pro) deacylase)/SAM-dependent methyltransferase
MKRHDILVAIGRYDDARVADIGSVHTDVDYLAATLRRVAAGGMPPSQTVITTARHPEAATKVGLLQALETALSDARPDDAILMTFLCHALALGGSSYLLPHDAVADEHSSFIDFAWLVEVLENVACRAKVVLIDGNRGSGSIGSDGTSTLGFDEAVPAVLRLFRQTGNVTFAMAARHGQRACLLPNGEQSIWVTRLADEIAHVSSSPAITAAEIEHILAVVAADTAEQSERWWGAAQTPFFLVRAERESRGLIAAHRDAAESREAAAKIVARATASTFEARFNEAFGKSMGVEFDRRTERELTHEGFTLSRVVHLGTASGRVRLAVIFDLMFRGEVSLDRLIDLDAIAGRHSLDRLVLLREGWPADIRKRAPQVFRKLHLVDLAQPRRKHDGFIRDFFTAPDFTETEVAVANEYSDRVLTEMGKLFHIVLADLAAPTYDRDYGEGSFGTQVAMAFEEEIVRGVIPNLDSKRHAVELGCGTGRHSFLLAQIFETVHAFDFSPGMIDVANQKKRAALLEGHNVGHLEFSVRDVEEDPLDFASNALDLVLGSFGMGSFVDDLVTFLLGIKDQLRPGGRAVFSFYNSGALVYQAPPPWRDTALSAVVIPERDELQVTLPSGDVFRIFCRPYTYSLLKGQLSRIFDTVHLYSCPAFASFLPANYFREGPASQHAREIIRKVDRELARHGNPAIGAYFTAVCGKRADSEASGKDFEALVQHRGEEELLAFLRAQGVASTVIAHERVRNIGDVQRTLDVDPDTIAKTILVVVRARPGIGEGSRHVALVLPGSRNVDLEKVSGVLGCSVRDWRFATQKEVKSVYGLEIGGVPPFGYSDAVAVYLDPRLVRKTEVVCGIGNPRRSLRLRGEDLLRVTRATVAGISAEDAA